MAKSLVTTLFLLCFVAEWGRAQANGAIQGKVTDASGAAIAGAVVTITGANGNRYTSVTDQNGAFQISSLPLANYNVKVSANGLSDWTAANVPASVNPASHPLVAVLQVPPKVTTVTVGVSPEQVATAQVNQQLKQRALGVFPNYFVAYEPHPAPLTPKLKARLAFRTLVDPGMLAGVAVTAGVEQARNSYWQYGQGAQGYAKRFGAAYAIATGAVVITTVGADSVFHQDPRYFYCGQGTWVQRARYAVESAFRTTGDNGKWQPPYSTIAGTIASAELSQAYLPGSRTQYTLLGRSIMFRFAGLVGLNLAQEFVLRNLTTHARRASLAENTAVLREGTPVPLIAVGAFSPRTAPNGQTVRFVLAQDLRVDGKVLANAGDIASGEVAQVSPGNTPGNVNSFALEDVKLEAGDVTVPLRSNQVRGEAGPTQYKKLPGSGKFELTLFVAQNVPFPGSE